MTYVTTFERQKYLEGEYLLRSYSNVKGWVTNIWILPIGGVGTGGLPVQQKEKYSFKTPEIELLY